MIGGIAHLPSGSLTSTYTATEPRVLLASVSQLVLPLNVQLLLPEVVLALDHLMQGTCEAANPRTTNHVVTGICWD